MHTDRPIAKVPKVVRVSGTCVVNRGSVPASCLNARAQYRLALYFDCGWMVSRDKAKAVELHTRAADQGDRANFFFFA